MVMSATFKAQNKAALDYFVQTPVTREMVSYLAQQASCVIKCDQDPLPSPSKLPTPPTTPPPAGASPPPASEQPLPSLEEFITSIIEQSHVQVPTLMPALIYLARLQRRLPAVAKGMRCTTHRIFLASLILAAKNLNDSSPKNKHWARYTTVPGYPHFGFSTSEVNLMEKQLLYLLDWDLRITNEDLYFHLEHFLGPIRDKQQEKAERKMQAMLRERELAHQQQIEQYRRLRSQSSSVPTATVQSSHSTQLSDTPQSMTSVSVADATVSYPQPRRLYPSRSSSRAPSRTPSLSPPGRCNSSAASSSYADSLPSASPASITQNSYSHPVGYEYDTKEQINMTQALYEPYFSSYRQEPEVVHLQPTDTGSQKMPMQLPSQIPMSLSMQKHYAPAQSVEDKPAKKLKTSAGNLFSRFLGGASANTTTAAAC